MKANQRFRNDQAEVGVGTLIVFIAMVLVAAVAAAVLLNTTGVLQQRAQSTGAEATRDVSSNLKVLNVYGVRNSTSLDVWDVLVNVELSAGSLPIDLTKVNARYADGTNTRNYAYSASALANGAVSSASFATTWIRGSGTNAVMAAGDLAQIHFNGYSGTVASRTSVQLTLTPEQGTQVSADFKTPPTYGGTDTMITLR